MTPDVSAPPDAVGPTAVALVGPTASGKSAIALEVADRLPSDSPGDGPGGVGGVGAVEMVSVDSMGVYRGMDIGTAKPTPEARAGVPYHLLDLVDPDEEFTVQQFQRRPGGPWPASPAGGTPPCWSGGPASTCGRWSTISTFPGRFPEVAAALSERTRPGRPRGSPGQLAGPPPAPPPPGGARPGGRRPDRADQPPPAGARPRGDAGLGPALLRVRARASSLPAEPGGHGRPRPGDRRARPAHRRAVRPPDGRGLLDEVRGAGRPSRGDLAHRPPGPRLPRAPGPRRGGRAAGRLRGPGGAAHPAFARRQRAWFRRDPRIVWLDPPAIRPVPSWPSPGATPWPPVGVGEWTSTR